jgi:hypothetical protein
MLIQVSNKKYQYFEIDDSDFELISKYTWGTDNGYIHTTIEGQKVRLHRFILGLVTNDGKVVDHKDGNRCNNKRDNLRLCTRSQNNINARKKSNNTSGFKGVTKYRNKWNAKIEYGGKYEHLGIYHDKIEAAKAYDKKASELFKEFANLNFDEDSENHFSKDLTSSFNFYKVSFSSKYYGVSFFKQSEKWLARTSRHLGYFKTEKEAALAVDDYIIKNNLDKSKLNFSEVE